jgi:hypothetical protein
LVKGKFILQLKILVRRDEFDGSNLEGVIMLRAICISLKLV